VTWLDLTSEGRDWAGPSNRYLKTGFYSPYFIVPKKGGGLLPILEPCVSWIRPFKRSLSRCQCRDASSNAFVPKIGLQRWTWRKCTFMSQFSLNTGCFCTSAFEGWAFYYKVLPFRISQGLFWEAIWTEQGLCTWHESLPPSNRPAQIMFSVIFPTP